MRDTSEAFLNEIYRALAVAELNKRRGKHYQCMLEHFAHLLDFYLDRKEIAPLALLPCKKLKRGQ